MHECSVECVQISKKEYDALLQENAEFKHQIAEYKREHEEYKQSYAVLEEQIRFLKKTLFGSKSEKTNLPNVFDVGYDQLTIFENMPGIKAEELANIPPSEVPCKENSVPDTRRKPGRRVVAIDLPEEEIVCDVPAEERKDENGEELVPIGYETSERLHYVPAKLVRQIIMRQILGHKDSREYKKVAEGPAFIISKGKFTNEFIEHLVFEKYFNGMPLYRQIKSLNALGADLSKSTASDAVREFAALYEPIHREIKKQVFSSPYVHADESPLKHGQFKDKVKTGYTFVFQDLSQVYFHYGGSRKQSEIDSVLSTASAEDGAFIGFLMSDGYAGYNGHKGIRIACWAHVRRRFFAIAKENKDAHVILDLINLLYRVEKEVRQEAFNAKWTEDQMLAVLSERRQTKSSEIIDMIKVKSGEFVSRYSLRSHMGRAISYTRNLWPNLIVYLENPILPIDNNAAERSLHSMVVGRKAFLFVGSEDAGRWSAICYTIMESCRLQQIDPRQYIALITPKLLELRKNPDGADYSSLTPKNLADQIRKMPVNM